MHGISNIVRPVHGLRFHRGPRLAATVVSRRIVGADPIEHVGLFVIAAIFSVGAAIRIGLDARIFTRRIKCRPGQVQPAACASVVQNLRFQQRQNPQGLRIAFEASAFVGKLIERGLTIVTIRRVADIVDEPCHLAQIRVQAQAFADATGNLRNLQGMRQASARSIPIARAHHLGFIR